MKLNQINVTVNFTDNKRINNKEYTVFSVACETVNLDRRFLSNLETVVTAFKELGTVDIIAIDENENENGTHDRKTIATIAKGGYTIGEKSVSFERFGGKIAKDFYNAVDDAIAELESTK